MKRISIFKRLLILVLVFILSINSFAAIVADNDGATFITKAEFDSLKNNFQAQIDNYNTSIDSKIEGAIASYLAGIKAATREEKKVNLNPNDESILFLSKNANAELINFYGTVGLDGDAVSVADQTGTATYLHGGQIWKSHIDNKPFTYALVRYDDNKIKLLKDVQIQWTIVNYTTSNYFDSPVAPNTLKFGLFYGSTSSYASTSCGTFDNGVQNKFKTMKYIANSFFYAAPMQQKIYDTSKNYYTYNQYYVQLPAWGHASWSWLPRAIEWKSSTDDNIRCLFSGESDWTSIACFSDPTKTTLNASDNVYAQKDNGSPYRLIDQACSMYVLRSSFSKDVNEYDGTSYACTTWMTHGTTDVEEGNSFNYTSLLPPMKIINYNALSDMKNFTGNAISINDGYPFFKNIDNNGTLDFELDCVTSYGSNWTVFVTVEPMALNARSTSKGKVNIKKQGDATYSQSVTWTSTSPLKLTIETEKDKQYYIYVMNTSTGKSPIFKFKEEGTQIIIHE